MGNLGPPLSGVGGRLNAGQIRSRVVDPTRANPDAAMPSYFRIHGSITSPKAIAENPYSRRSRLRT